MSIVKFFSDLEIRFVTHPEGKYEFGVVATDLARVLEIVNSRDLPIKDKWKGVGSIDTPGGTQSMTVVWEPGVYHLLSVSRKPNAEPFQDWLFEEVIPNIRKTGGYSVKSEPLALQPVTDETVKVHIQGIKYLTDNGDLQLAQLLKVQFGNRMLAEHQNFLNPADVPQYEGVIDVAIRLGFNVPKNYESALGVHVAKQFKVLAIGKDKRYSMASAKQVGANMYPANDPEVEQSVLDYCLTKAFYRREMNWIA